MFKVSCLLKPPIMLQVKSHSSPYLFCPFQAASSLFAREWLNEYVVFSSEPLLVLIEYVPYGDLLGYLRKSRGLNDTYFKDPDIKPQTSLTSQQLMKFSWQVADGMSYLSSRSVSYNADCLHFANKNYTVKNVLRSPHIQPLFAFAFW